ncbi:hypothetical protein BC827DRAFT_1202322 [Russula dissimulans]|nr:hypothetical protein BC827DRAFT_1202322 [Russula dissimulans]
MVITTGIAFPLGLLLFLFHLFQHSFLGCWWRFRDRWYTHDTERARDELTYYAVHDTNEHSSIIYGILSYVLPRQTLIMLKYGAHLTAYHHLPEDARLHPFPLYRCAPLTD